MWVGITCARGPGGTGSGSGGPGAGDTTGRAGQADDIPTIGLFSLMLPVDP